MASKATGILVDTFESVVTASFDFCWAAMIMQETLENMGATAAAMIVSVNVMDIKMTPTMMPIAEAPIELETSYPFAKEVRGGKKIFFLTVWKRNHRKPKKVTSFQKRQCLTTSYLQIVYRALHIDKPQCDFIEVFSVQTNM